MCGVCVALSLSMSAINDLVPALSVTTLSCQLYTSKSDSLIWYVPKTLSVFLYLEVYLCQYKQVFYSAIVGLSVCMISTFEDLCEKNDQNKVEFLLIEYYFSVP